MRLKMDSQCQLKDHPHTQGSDQNALFLTSASFVSVLSQAQSRQHLPIEYNGQLLLRKTACSARKSDTL
jgi:hypothetical protein